MQFFKWLQLTIFSPLNSVIIIIFDCFVYVTPRLVIYFTILNGNLVEQVELL
jgi:hypothetical protein